MTFNPLFCIQEQSKYSQFIPLYQAEQTVKHFIPVSLNKHLCTSQFYFICKKNEYVHLKVKLESFEDYIVSFYARCATRENWKIDREEMNEKKSIFKQQRRERMKTK